MTPVRLGAVGYLNARPLVEGLDRQSDRFSLRFDAPSRCAALLQQGAIDVGMIPSIEYLRGPEYRIVPGVALASCGPVASVAMFSSLPAEKVRSIATDDSSRTSVGLLQVLCRYRFRISPRMVTMPPDLDAMLGRADAALVIGDPALFLDHRARGLSKIDLGGAWTDMTGLPFVWAFWAGRPGALTTGDITALQAAKVAGVAAVDRIADACCGSAERAQVGRTYLRENMKFDLGRDEQAGLSRYYELAVGDGLAAAARPLAFF